MLASALPVTSAVLQEHLQNGVVAESACSALWALALQGVCSQSPLGMEKAGMSVCDPAIQAAWLEQALQMAAEFGTCILSWPLFPALAL